MNKTVDLDHIRREIEKSADGASGALSGICTSLAATLSDPSLVKAAAEKTETVKLTTKAGKTVEAAFAVPEQISSKLPTLLLFHEWWGLNDQIKAVATEFAKEGFIALAVDLYGGAVTTDADEALKLMMGLDVAASTEIAVSWAEWLKGFPPGNGKLGTVGWCMGGGWSLNTSIATPVDATVIYYGDVSKTADTLQTLKGPVLGHFATKDGFFNPEMVKAFEAEMQKASKPLTIHWYEADHAFANPTGDNYMKEDAQTAWARTLEFFNTQLKS